MMLDSVGATYRWLRSGRGNPVRGGRQSHTAIHSNEESGDDGEYGKYQHLADLQRRVCQAITKEVTTTVTVIPNERTGLGESAA